MALIEARFKAGDRVYDPKYGFGYVHKTDGNSFRLYYDCHYEDGTKIWYDCATAIPANEVTKEMLIRDKRLKAKKAKEAKTDDVC